MTNPEKIVIVGAGLMGHGLALVFAEKGHPVWLVDNNAAALEVVPQRIREILERMQSQGIDLDRSINDAINLVHTTTAMAEAVKECDFVFECVFENMELKQSIFADLDRMCPPETILCSNTSVMSITEIASKSTNRQRIIGTHFWNPPYLLPLVEVVRTEDTTEDIANVTFSLLKRAGKHPIHVYKDVPGFVANRMQHALWREAYAIIDEGICDPATVDEAVRNSFGMRLPILGPVENADMIGLDLTLAVHDYILKYINADPTPSTTLQAKAKAGELGFKTGSGFMEWSDDSIKESRQQLVDYLIKVVAEKQKSGRNN
jgi:3-hydroxybutyryl-CoA dehydrogenase